MQSLDKIKRRIRSVQTTSKITGAMRLVATAKIKKQMHEFKGVGEFCESFYRIIEDLVKTIPAKEIGNKNHSKNKLWIVITSSLGLCGAFNINVCKHLVHNLQPDDDILIFGRKGYSFLNNHGYGLQIKDHIEISESNLNYLEILPVTESIIAMFNTGKYQSVHVIYTKFINSLTFEPRSLQILPLDSTLFKSPDQLIKPEYVDLSKDHKQIMYEPTKVEILNSCIPIYVTTSLFAAISESKLCENGARRNAMETATDNAKELIDELKLEFNRVRQETITQEINEIVAGANGAM